MSGYVLCQIKRAKLPYYIESISTNIYSIEELCYYLYHNVYLIDHTIINEHLCDWIRDELGLVKLYRILYEHLDREESMSNFVLPIFKEISYLSHSEFKKLQEKITYIESQPEDARKKLKGDYLVNNKMYSHAIREYHPVLLNQEKNKMGNRFYASVWGNMGCAYARLFLYEEAAKCFEEAYHLDATVYVYEKYLCALRMSMTEEEFTRVIAKNYVKIKAVVNLKTKMQEIQKAVEEDPDYQMYLEAKKYKANAERKSYEAEVKKLLHKLSKDYEKSTGA